MVLIVKYKIEPKQRAHSSLLAAGLASESKTDKKSLRSKLPIACCGELQMVQRAGELVHQN